MEVGYARMSTREQSFDLQIDALRAVKRFTAISLTAPAPNGRCWSVC
jgi:DNA invertase Pin-like site-specific DNA recombinase